MGLAVPIAVGGERGAADRGIPQVGIGGVERLCPRIVSVEPVLEGDPALAAVPGAGDALAGGLVDALGRKRMRAQVVGVAVGLWVVVNPRGATIVGAKHAAQLDSDCEPVRIGRVKGDGANVMCPRAGWV